MVAVGETSLTMLDRVRSVADGAADETAWQEFVGRYGPWIWTWLRRQGLQAADAEDVRQEAMLTILAAIADFEHNGRVGAFRRWLELVVGNRLRVWRRKQRKQPRPGGSVLDQIAEQLGDPNNELSQCFAKGFRMEVLRARFSSLENDFHPKTFTAAKRVLLDGCKARDVAKELGMRDGAVRTAVCRVLAKLRKRLSASFFE